MSFGALLTTALGFVAVPLGAGLALVASQRPLADPRAEGGAGLAFPTDLPAEGAPLEDWRPRDGARLGLRRYPSGRPGAPLMILIHGSGWHGLQFDGLARRIAGAGLADCLAPDLRGHGPAPERRGDVDYIGQMEDDLADLIAAERRPGQRVILLGHSSGGGLVVRFAGGRHGQPADGAVLLAPFLGHRAPTTRAASGGWAHVLTRRIIGLSMLNGLFLHALDHLTVIQFRFPSAVLDGPLGKTATRDYSHRLNTGYAPRRKWQRDVAALPRTLLIVGKKDEAFEATAYPGVLRACGVTARIATLAGVGHLGVVGAEESFAAIADWLTEERT